MEQEQMEKQPLLLLSGTDCHATERGEKTEEDNKWTSYQHHQMGRSASVYAHVPSSEVTVNDIRSASVFPPSSSDPSSYYYYYSPSIHAPLITTPDPLPPPQYPQDKEVVFQGGYGSSSGYASKEYERQVLDEVEIRQLLIDHVGHHCCWGSQPAKRWKISAVEDCNVYIGTLETFTEERELLREIEPYVGGELDRKEKKQELGIWELDLRSEFPLLFVPQKEARVKFPHSEAIEKCSGCEGQGEIACPTCNAGQQPGFCKENLMSQCPTCYGRGLIAHRDGSDTICTKCSGKGLLPCVACGSHGLIKCHMCGGQGSLLSWSVALVRWRTLSNRKVTAASGAASVPDEVFHKARGVQLYNTQAYQCTPAYFADSYLLNRFSSEVIADRSPVPPSARVICERHTISVVPVTRVTMAHQNRSLSFYIIGFSREVYIRDYPSKFCWGLCCCFEWLKT